MTWTEVKGPKADLIIFQKRKKLRSLYENLTIFFLYGHFGVLKLRSLFILLVYRYKSFFGLKKKLLKNCLKKTIMLRGQLVLQV